MTERFDEIIKLMPPFRQQLSGTPQNVKNAACEIRVRAGKPLIIETLGERYICGQHKASAEEIYSCIKHFCDFSLYSYERELAEGWITLRGGHRAGFSGTAVVRGGKIDNIREISSLNVRIARENIGAADGLMRTALCGDLKGLLIIGKPMSGKTTVLRDCCRQLSANHKTAAIDERGEIAAVYNGVPQNDTGINCDVLCGYPKKDGIMQALRSLSPEYIISDETGDEYRELAECAGKGVKLILTAHCGSIDEASQNRTVSFLTENKAVNYAALLGSGSETGIIKGIYRIGDNGGFNLCGGDDNFSRCRNSNTYVT